MLFTHLSKNSFYTVFFTVLKSQHVLESIFVFLNDDLHAPHCHIKIEAHN